MSRKPKNPQSTVEDYLSSTSSLIKAEADENLPLYVQFQYNPQEEPDQLATDEAEVILAYEDGLPSRQKPMYYPVRGN